MRPHPQYARSAFSFPEVLAAFAVIAVLAALALPAFNWLGQVNLLSAAGNRIVNLANYARQNSMSKNSMTALIVLTDPRFEEQHRAITLLELKPPADGAQPDSKDWQQIIKWETLGHGVIVDPLADNYPGREFTFSFNKSSDVSPVPGVPNPPFSALHYGGQPINIFCYTVYLPDGNLLSGTPAQIRVTEGDFPRDSTVPVYTRPNTAGRPLNYYDITVLPETGRTIINRP